MLITCPKCASSHPVDPSSLSPAGGSVRCARCGHGWFVANKAAMAAIEQAYRAEIAEFSCNLGSPSAGAEAVQAIKASAAMPAHAQAEDPGQEVLIDRTHPGQAAGGAAIGHHSSAIERSVLALPAAPAGARFAAAARQPACRTLEENPCDAARRNRDPRRQRRWASVGAGALIPSLIAANLALIGWHADLVRLFPQTASLYAAVGLPVNVRGIAFADFSAMRDPQKTGPSLLLKGRLVNLTQRMVRLAELRFSLRDEEGREVYQWTEPPAKGALAPGEALVFEAQLASPPDRGKEVAVRFVSLEESYSASRQFPLNAVAGVR